MGTLLFRGLTKERMYIAHGKRRAARNFLNRCEVFTDDVNETWHKFTTFFNVGNERSLSKTRCVVAIDDKERSRRQTVVKRTQPTIDGVDQIEIIGLIREVRTLFDGWRVFLV